MTIFVQMTVLVLVLSLAGWAASCLFSGLVDCVRAQDDLAEAPPVDPVKYETERPIETRRT